MELPRVLVLSRNYPNNIFPTLGLWTQRLVLASRAVADPVVVAPVQYVPPGVRSEYYARHRRIDRRRREDGIDVHHPRVPAGPGYLLHRFDARLTYPAIRGVTDRLHEARPLALIHAHLIYPAGVVAARLGRRYGVPVVTTEHAPWTPWLDRFPSVRRQVLRQLPAIHTVTAVSEALLATVREVAGERVRTALFENVVDDTTFRAPQPAEEWDPDQILFVGSIRYVKGFDVLVRALARLAPRRPRLSLRVLGHGFYRAWEREEAEMRALVEALGLTARVHFAGSATPVEVAAEMRRSALLVIPSRREGLPAVGLEALASGTPIVATRCGGLPEIVTSATGRLVPTEDQDALARAIEEVLDARAGFDRAQLRESVVSRFGMAATAERFAALYGRMLDGVALRTRQAPP